MTTYVPWQTLCCAICCVPGAVPRECLRGWCRCHWYADRIYTDPEGLVEDLRKKREVAVSQAGATEKT